MSQATDASSRPPSPEAASTSPAAPRPPRLALLIATGFGLGYLPNPGTWSSLLALLIAWLLWSPGVPNPFGHPEGLGFDGVQIWPPTLVDLVLIASISALGVYCSGRGASIVREVDRPRVVIDEVSGQLLALIGGGLVVSYPSDAVDGSYLFVLVSPNWKYLLAGFILFRVLSMWKPWPVRRAGMLPGGWGIMADDWVAGTYSALCLFALRRIGF